MSKKKKTFKDIKIKKPINVVEEVLPPPIEPEPVVQQQPDPMALLMQANEPEPVVQQQLDPMMLLMQATAQLAQGINTMLEGQKLQTDALLSIKESLSGQEEARKISEQELRQLQEEKPLHTESKTYYIQPLMGYDVDQNPIYNDAIGMTFKTESEAEDFASEKIGKNKYRIYHISSVAAVV